ncbi:cytokinin dehydrogenase 3-like [Apium graveolens]|uniref:cytokinin dehydrogenase 3-like n=1 Tax=Apium graveolens TaxID=4045 RepID=UPI003D79D1C8
MAKSYFKHAYFILSFIISRSIWMVSKLKPWKTNHSTSLPYELFSLDIAAKLHVDSNAIKMSSSDFGNMVKRIPSAVVLPTHITDIIDLVKFSYNSSSPFTIAARGHGHSVRGQAMASNGVVVDMTSLNKSSNGNGIRVSRSSSLGFYADVGGEQLWIDVLKATLEHGLAPVSWTDYLYLTVGGTLSNGGVSGQTFLHGPQISNVHELDVVTGKGEILTCSKHLNPELFYAVLGGLGQFGIITRARIVLDKAPKRVKWIRMLYQDFSSFTGDQEHLISNNKLDYVEGSLILHQSSSNNWKSSFFSNNDQSNIASLLSKHGILYCLEVVKYYDDSNINTIEQELQLLLNQLNFNPGFVFKKDVSFIDFLNRVRAGELYLQSQGQWDVPHPWLNLFVPKSRILDFHAGVFINIIQAQNKSTGPILVYPTNRKKWDNRMSAVTPDEDVFYCVGLLHSAGADNWEALDAQNREILEFCDKSGIMIKQYLPHYSSKDDWMNHFGEKWNNFRDQKLKYDPKMILAPGQRIFR